MITAQCEKWWLPPEISHDWSLSLGSLTTTKCHCCWLQDEGASVPSRMMTSTTAGSIGVPS